MKNITEYISECIENPVMIQEKLVVKKVTQLGLIEANREAIIKSFTPYFHSDKVKKRKFIWIQPKNAQEVLRKYEGKGWTTDTPLEEEDKQKMIDLITNNGGWYLSLNSEDYDYRKSTCNKFIISIIEKDGKHVAVVMGGYSGNWAAEDYLFGKYEVKEIPLETVESK